MSIFPSLIVATYNWPEALELCLKSIQQQTILPAEVVIADDGSAGATTLIIQEFQTSFPVPLIHVYHEDLGFRKSIILNKAIKKAAGKYIIQVDGDVILDRHFIADHISVSEPSTFVRGTRAHISEEILPEVFKTKKTQFSFLSKGIINRFNAIRFPLLSFLFQKKEENSNSVRGSNLAYWKKDFEQINGYNNDLSGWGHEDEELAARFINNNILKKGVKFKAVQFHLYHKLASREKETNHISAVTKTIGSKLKTCSNGFNEVNQDE